MVPSFQSRIVLVSFILGALGFFSLACEGKQGPTGPNGSPVTVYYVPVTGTFTPTFPPGTLTATPTATSTPTPTFTPTSTPTPVPTFTPTSTSVPTSTPTSTSTP